MDDTQKEFYETLIHETEQKVKTYKDFAKQIEIVKNINNQTIKGLRQDMRFIERQIEANNQLLSQNGLETVRFDR